jgi:L-lactate dehydrogenase complex protein LldG
MNSRERILQAVGRNQPPFQPLPEAVEAAAITDTRSTFAALLQRVGGSLRSVSGISDIRAFVDEERTSGKWVLASVPGMLEDAAVGDRSAADLERVDTAVLRGTIGVAENAAVWLPESAMGHRALPFLCQHLVLVLRAEDIVPDMQAAYARIQVAAGGYGVFIAGPSKTADIEQSLVIGAHGPLALSVFVIE